jgi:prepilin-type N-terminal cleavage/methylation domain-containing protein
VESREANSFGPNRQCRPVAKRRSPVIVSGGFTLVELLVVVAVIGVLLAIFIPALRLARERGQRAVCLSNLRQLTLAWTAYADEHGGKLVYGNAFAKRTSMRIYRLNGWVGNAFMCPPSRSALMENPDKGALWPYLRNADVYHCPLGSYRFWASYSILAGANGPEIEGTYVPHTNEVEASPAGKRIGNTVLRPTRLTDIISPPASERAVFIDRRNLNTDFDVDYLHPYWWEASPPPIHHAAGVPLSMADGHAEYWKWKGRETVTMPRICMYGLDSLDLPPPAHWYQPHTEDGLYDLMRLQKATWGRVGYSPEVRQ